MFGANYEKERREIYEKRAAGESFLAQFCKTAEECLKLKKLTKNESSALENILARCKDENALYSRCLEETGEAYFKKMVEIENSFSRFAQSLAGDTARLKDALISQKKNENLGNCQKLLAGMTDLMNQWINNRECRREQQMSAIKDQVIKAIEGSIKEVLEVGRWRGMITENQTVKEELDERQKQTLDRLNELKKTIEDSNVLDTDEGEKLAKTLVQKNNSVREIYTKDDRISLQLNLEALEDAVTALVKNAKGRNVTKVNVFGGYAKVSKETFKNCDDLTLYAYLMRSKAYEEQFQARTKREDTKDFAGVFEWENGLEENVEYKRAQAAHTRADEIIRKLKPQFKSATSERVRNELMRELNEAKAVLDAAESRISMLKNDYQRVKVDIERLNQRKAVQEQIKGIFKIVYDGDLSVRDQADLMLAYGLDNIGALYDEYKEAMARNDEATVEKISRSLDMIESNCNTYVAERKASSIKIVDDLLGIGEKETKKTEVKKEPQIDITWLDDYPDAETETPDEPETEVEPEPQTPVAEPTTQETATETQSGEKEPAADGNVTEVNMDDYNDILKDIYANMNK